MELSPLSTKLLLSLVVNVNNVKKPPTTNQLNFHVKKLQLSHQHSFDADIHSSLHHLPMKDTVHCSLLHLFICDKC